MEATISPHRIRLQEFLERDSVRNAILAVIIFNAVTLGLSTSQWVSARFGPILSMIDRLVISIFVIELALKLYAFRLSFFRSAWNIFDFCVVAIALMPQTDNLSVLRALRVIRALRLLSAIPQMRAVIKALLDALPGMGAVIILLGIVYYVFAVMATMMYREDFPDWFGTVGASLYSLFQIMTLESWSMGIVRPVMEQHPYAWAFFVPFIIITAFAVLNLFIGLLVNTMQSAVEDTTEAELEKLSSLVAKETNELDAHVLALHEDVRALRSEVDKLLGGADG